MAARSKQGSGKTAKGRKDRKDGKGKVAKKRAPLLTHAQVEIFRKFMGVALGLFALFTLIALVSYLFTWQTDQSLLSDGAQAEAAVNGGGRFGFGWARLLMTRLFGIGAFAAVVILGGASLLCFRRRVRFWRLLFVTAFGAVIVSLAASLTAGFFGPDLTFGEGIGGGYGTAVAGWLKDQAGIFGAYGVLLLMAIVLLLLSSNRFCNWFLKFGEKTADAGAEAADGGAADEDEAAEDEAAVSVEDEAEDGEDDAQDDDLASVYDDEDDEASDVEEDECEADDAALEDGQPDADDGVVELEPFRSQDTGYEELSAGPDEIRVEDMPMDSNVPDGGVKERYDPRLDLPHYKFPGLELLNDYNDKWFDVSQDELQRNNMKITSALADYRIQVQSVSARKGPTVTLYEIVPARGTKISQLKRLEEDIARSIGVKGVRVLTLLNTIGIEVPNEKPSVVPMKSILNDPVFRNNKFELPVAMGYTISQKVLAFDLTKAPHLLVAGATGQGKSVGLNAILTSLLYSKHPAELKFVLVDPKRVELSIYRAIENHFLAMLPDGDKPILTDTSKVVRTLKSLCAEMESRYELLEKARVRSISDYNEKFLDRQLNPYNGHKYLPYIVVVIDEFADLLCTAGREIEEPISRLAAKARAIGIHLIIATQRPTTDVITGLIKANFPSRIAFKVLSGVDSKTILDEVGANRLIGRGDMLIKLAGGDEMTRVQCAFVDTEEAIRVSEFIGAQRGYGSPYYLPECEDEEEGASNSVDLGRRDPLFEEAARLIVASQQGSTSLIQRKMEIGYNRAGRIIDQLEAAGIIGPFEGSKARKVLVQDFDQLEGIMANLDSKL